MARWGLALVFALLGAVACTPDSTRPTAAPGGGAASPTASTGAAVRTVPAKAPPSGPPSPRQKARYLEKCVASVCQLAPREAAFVESDDGPFAFTSWSPDRTQRASLVSTTPPIDPRPAPERLSLRIFDARTGRSVDLVQVNRQHDEVPPVWSPDGALIAFESPGPGGDRTATVDIVAADGTGRRTVSPPDAVYACCASWSADGSEIAMSVWLRGASSGAIVVASTRGEAARHLDTPGLNAFTPAWLADERIAFLAQAGSLPQVDLYAIDADGADLVQLTTEGAFTHPVGHRQLVVSEDRRCIAYLSERDGAYALWTQCLGRSEREASRVTSPSVVYAWLTDGRLALFGATDCEGLLAVRVETDERECVVY